MPESRKDIQDPRARAQKVINLIIAGDLNNAVPLFQDMVGDFFAVEEGNPDYITALSLISQYNRCNRDWMNGLTTWESANLVFNRVTANMLQLITKLKQGTTPAYVSIGTAHRTFPGAAQA